MAPQSSSERRRTKSRSSDLGVLGGLELLSLQLPGDDAADASDSDTSRAGSDHGLVAPLFHPHTSSTTQGPKEQESEDDTHIRRHTEAATSPSSAEAQSNKSVRDVADQSLRKAVRRSIFHLLPGLCTATLLVLSALEVYFGDLNGYPEQEFALQALQFAVKAHEILMTMSIGSIVLHRIRWDMIRGGGVPFGLIPQLRWWTLNKPFGSTNLRLFASNSTQEQVWPIEVPALPCSAWICPSHGVPDIVRWVGSLQWNEAAAEIPFVSGGDSFFRWAISNATDHSGWSVSTSPSMWIRTAIGSYWNWIDYQALAPAASLEQPQISIVWLDGQPVLQPLVQVECSAYTSNDTLLQDTELPNDMLRVDAIDMYKDVSWSVPGNYTNMTALDLAPYDWSLYWAKLPLENYKHAPTVGLVLIMPNENHTKTVVPCSVLAHWVPSELSVMPKADRNIHTVQSNPLDVINSSDANLSQTNQILLSDDW
ncbi:hypothetical protein LTR37_008125 [Vermiconidia calcicola]|uniref:Uncharacterized protein n=1 Tax=Vermiconidia calcicola TaxID=1690605 RepID=A0ACC3NC28_9PEZI|nr:hypothetical protein LTR37_008125 [Vermiconidia calcicola]